MAKPGPRKNPQYAPLDNLQPGESAFVPIRYGQRHDAVRTRIYQIARSAGWKAHTQLSTGGWRVLRREKEHSPTRGGWAADILAKLRTEPSVLLPAMGPAERQKARVLARQFARQRGWKVAVRQVPEGIRVYRGSPPRKRPAMKYDWSILEEGRGNILRLAVFHPEDKRLAALAAEEYARKKGWDVSVFDTRSVNPREDGIDIVRN